MTYFGGLVVGLDITYSVTHGGWLGSPLARGWYCDIRIEVTPDSTFAVGATKDVLLRARLFADLTKQDVIKVVTTKD